MVVFTRYTLGGIHLLLLMVRMHYDRSEFNERIGLIILVLVVEWCLHRVPSNSDTVLLLTHALVTCSTSLTSSWSRNSLLSNFQLRNILAAFD